jgi:hypothetical protein
MMMVTKPWRVSALRVLAVAVCSWLCQASSSMAAVVGTPLMALPNAALRLTAYDGYVVFSQRDAGS